MFKMSKHQCPLLKLIRTYIRCLLHIHVDYTYVYLLMLLHLTEEAAFVKMQVIPM